MLCYHAASYGCTLRKPCYLEISGFESYTHGKQGSSRRSSSSTGRSRLSRPRVMNGQQNAQPKMAKTLFILRRRLTRLSALLSGFWGTSELPAGVSFSSKAMFFLSSNPTFSVYGGFSSWFHCRFWRISGLSRLLVRLWYDDVMLVSLTLSVPLSGYGGADGTTMMSAHCRPGVVSRVLHNLASAASLYTLSVFVPLVSPNTERYVRVTVRFVHTTTF